MNLKDIIHNTPLKFSETFSQMVGSSIYLKYENQQKTGSFKVRGAHNKIVTLIKKGAPPAVIASSAGNHAQGVAFAASSLGIKSTIVMPKSTPIAKVAATEEYGAEIVLHGDCYDDAYKKAMDLQAESGAVFIHPFDDEDVIAGQATIGFEILRDLPDVDIVILPAGGGGLLAGVAYYIKQLKPHVKIIGVQSTGADAIVRSFSSSEYVTTEKAATIADGIAVKIPGTMTVSLIQKYVDEMVTVTDGEIAAAILLLLERDKQVVEPAGAASLAAVLSNRLDLADKKAACVLSGGNIDVSFIHKIVEKGLVSRGRQLKLRTVMLDKPGSLEKFASIASKCGANIIMVQHDRLDADLNINEAILHVNFEVSSPKHGKELVQALEQNGYKVTIE
ncbi:threonine ammonia-lyase [Desulfuribacillus alkaliarsenatis]|uniref:L-threonine dehydratase catabolic TdcB n=2 Tax=Desulfuribacillus alkaliarsenatis TaxID=766136 RepID=A0A1E5G2H8_9FIRM|nr:threonine ammonia-lyase [Desulfuribacillus alkaliarsenatis]